MVWYSVKTKTKPNQKKQQTNQTIKPTEQVSQLWIWVDLREIAMKGTQML